jgi:hypothetical protein
MSHILGLDKSSRKAALEDLATLQITLEKPEQDVTTKGSMLSKLAARR